MAAYVIPSTHTPGYLIQDVSGSYVPYVPYVPYVQGPSTGGSGPSAIGQITPLTPIPNHWSTMESGEDVRIYPSGMQMDVSGNVLYPY